MAENTVVKEQLTEAMIDAGAEVTRKLDEAGLRSSAAFWLFVTEDNEWRLFIALPEVSSQGPRRIYEHIRVILEDLGERASAAPLSVIGLLDPDAELVRLLKMAIRTGPEINRIRFSRNAINGHFIEDALIYRVA